MIRIGLLSFVIAFTCALNTSGQTISAVAGNGVAGFSGDSSAATSAHLTAPYGIAVDGSGNIYFVDQANQRIRKVDGAGIITTIAGNGTSGYNGDSILAVNAEFNNAEGLAVDASGNVYVADWGNNRIRKISTSGMITTVAGTGVGGFGGDNGAAVAAKLNLPSGVAVDSHGNLFIADWNNQRIRKIDTSGIITTIAGNGAVGFNGDNVPSATYANLCYPRGVAVDNLGNVYIADQGNARIRKVDTSNKISTVYGNGFTSYESDGYLAVNTPLYSPSAVAVDSLGDIYVSDEQHYVIRKVSAPSNSVVTLAGDGTSGYSGDTGYSRSTQIGDCKGVAVDRYGNVFFTDWSNDRVNSITSTLSVKSVGNFISSGSIYPNPNNGSFTVNVSSSDEEKLVVVITNALGQVVSQLNTFTNKPFFLNLNVPAGLYVVTATQAGGSKWSASFEVGAR